MLSKLGDALNRFARRFVPDPFVLALGLTAVVFAIGALRLAISGTPTEAGIFWTLTSGWLADFSSPRLLAFALQMCLVLVTGHALATSPPVQRAIAALAGLPRSAGAATVLVSLFACAAALIHWGLGAIAGALLAREIGRHASARDLPLHYPLLGAAAYTGMAVWHGGLSGSAPLKVAEGDPLVGAIELGDMLLSPLNLAVTGSLLILIPALLYWMTPRRREDMIGPDLSAALAPARVERSDEEARSGSVVRWLQDSPIPGVAVGAAGLLYLGLALAAGRIGLDINSVNALFLFLGIALQGSLLRYVEAVADGARGAGAIIIQFPLYFGVLGVMKASGLVEWVSAKLVAVSGTASFPVLDFLSAGVVNFFVPSGGGQWAVQRDILLGAGSALEVDPVTTIMAFSYGDAWTNMLQPFWALPLLGIMGLRARDIIGYTALVLVMMAVVVPAWLLILG